jgi:hypothetical protein
MFLKAAHELFRYDTSDMMIGYYKLYGKVTMNQFQHEFTFFFDLTIVNITNDNTSNVLFKSSNESNINVPLQFKHTFLANKFYVIVWSRMSQPNLFYFKATRIKISSFPSVGIKV